MTLSVVRSPGTCTAPCKGTSGPEGCGRAAARVMPCSWRYETACSRRDEVLGRAVVGCALARGHEVTLFNRGRTNPDLFPAAEKLRGTVKANSMSCGDGSGTRSSIPPVTCRASSIPPQRCWQTPSGITYSFRASRSMPTDPAHCARTAPSLDSIRSTAFTSYVRTMKTTGLSRGALRAGGCRAVRDSTCDRSARTDRWTPRPDGPFYLLAAPHCSRRRRRCSRTS